MKKYIAVVDYGMGNLMSVSKALEQVYNNVVVTESANKIKNASAVVLPGVGAFCDAFCNLDKRKLIKPVIDSVASGKPYLGICLGLQLLFTESEENGKWPGMGIIEGKVKRFPKTLKLKVPQIGWNRINFKKNEELFSGVKNGAFVYFVHSYYGMPTNKDDIAAFTEYGIKFPSAISRGNIIATQFHPEKSQNTGLRILKNFVKRV